MARSRRKNRHVARLQLKSTSLRSSELNLAAAARDAKHFVGAGMIVNIVVDAVPPHIAPTIAFEQLFKDCSGIQRLRQANRAFVDDERPARMIRNKAVVLEAVGIWLALPKQLPRIVWPLPSRRFLDDVFDVLQQRHERFLCF